MYIALIFVFSITFIEGTIIDDTCYTESAKRLLEKTSQGSDPEFHKSLEEFRDSPFRVVLKYCLGPKGDVSSHKFVECVTSHNSCTVPWYSTVNWEFCLCNTVHCIVSNCLQYWLETGNLTNIDCFSHCLPKSYKCIAKQTGSLKSEY
ncbi:signal peptide containing protein [Theileria equi strain WA]|uniref:Signal peptide containing protein n=1 Tax=Theileria equi strain WA TaxID=1537102 RepID=L1LGV1_THEEQ|nr:signal peptide containing protein [Theileria equi strain WA]EKX74348.1 signal peptide containing protein [Theileria equi strain WA]|eukprot:XP_004833800.1 signal peptide containing protein [Theileria equi strain WA]